MNALADRNSATMLASQITRPPATIRVNYAITTDPIDRAKDILYIEVSGFTEFDTEVFEALHSPSDSYSNAVYWNSTQYIIDGHFNSDPRKGDHPANLEARLAAIVGIEKIASRITLNGELIFDGGTQVELMYAPAYC